MIRVFVHEFQRAEGRDLATDGMKLLVDANVFRHPARSEWVVEEDQLVMWGPWLSAHRTLVRQPATLGDNEIMLRREIPFVPALAAAGPEKGVQFFTYQLLEMEGWGIKSSIDWEGREIRALFDLQPLQVQHQYCGILFGDGVDLNTRIQNFVDDISEPRFLELIKVLGKKHSQDALHALVCEQHGLDGVLTLDNKIREHFRNSKKRLNTPVNFFLPSEICEQFGIDPAKASWFAPSSDPFAKKQVQLFQRKATWRDRVLYNCYRALMTLRHRYGVKVRFIIPGYEAAGPMDARNRVT